jgi:cation diffusion facilitator family transporter
VVTETPQAGKNPSGTNHRGKAHSQQNLLGTDASGEARTRQKRAERVVNLGLGSNAVLAATKLSAGILAHSQALLADGINSVSDVVYFVVVRILVSLSGKPSDEEHPYGHRQFESIAAVVVGAFVITTGLAIFWDSINTAFDLLTGASTPRPIRLFALFVAAGTIATKIALMLHARSVATSIKSLALSALARDHRNDIFASLGAAVGIVCGLLGFPIWDPVAGAIVAVVVAKTGVEILQESTAELMDTVPSKHIDRQVRSVLEALPEVACVDEVHAHRFGPYYVLNITIGIDGDLSVARGNQIAHEAEEALKERIDMLRRVYVHYHPGRRADNHYTPKRSGTPAL